MPIRKNSEFGTIPRFIVVVRSVPSNTTLRRFVRLQLGATGVRKVSRPKGAMAFRWYEPTVNNPVVNCRLYEK